MKVRYVIIIAISITFSVIWFLVRSEKDKCDDVKSFVLMNDSHKIYLYITC